MWILSSLVREEPHPLLSFAGRVVPPKAIPKLDHHRQRIHANQAYANQHSNPLNWIHRMVRALFEPGGLASKSVPVSLWNDKLRTETFDWHYASSL